MFLETPEQRSKNMKAIKSHDTKIEIILRKALWKRGIHYRKNFKIFSCHPDIVLTKYKIAIFCDGDFWHGKVLENRSIKSNAKYWNEKIKRNMERDFENTIELRDPGWSVLRFWETEIKTNLTKCIADIIKNIEASKNKQ